MSGPDEQRHAALIRRHAELLGYRYVSTVRPPADDTDPIGYALGLAAGLDAAALVVYDLVTLDHTPSRACELFDLETVSPPETWTVSVPGIADRAHAHPDRPLTVVEAHRVLQRHIKCDMLECPLKSSAYSALVKAGKVVPPAQSQRVRAAARGIKFPRKNNSDVRLPVGVTTQTLLEVLDGLANRQADPRGLAARLGPGPVGPN
ncbi:hypothetical protein BJY24_001461 [Nocardia transvalensis]|uniref:Uncharacterized protein n=1 Tax=Nocardia transvalensis TaxID=37333 RepID=A0A7W9PAN7_9NOCA|nr:hypothetical protein [Nocardia transvalensis]MBB5912594.1 hypothetical protein [Nocardia transvalensis]